MTRSFRLLWILMLVVILSGSVLLGMVLAVPVQQPLPPNYDLAKSLGMILPGIVYALKLLIATIFVTGSLIGSAIAVVGRVVMKKAVTFDAKLDFLYQAILRCDGCKESVRKTAETVALGHEL